MREKKGGALQKLKKRLSHSFGRLCKYELFLYRGLIIEMGYLIVIMLLSD